jgi:hypothetical protein
MRRVLASVLFAGLFSSAAYAEEAAPPPAPEPAPAPAPAPAARKTPLRVVRVLPETHQALMFDKTRGTHVLVETGKLIDGFKVDDIDEDTVTLTPIDGGAQIVLADPTRAGAGIAMQRRHRPPSPRRSPKIRMRRPRRSTRTPTRFTPPKRPAPHRHRARRRPPLRSPPAMAACVRPKPRTRRLLPCVPCKHPAPRRRPKPRLLPTPPPRLRS